MSLIHQKNWKQRKSWGRNPKKGKRERKKISFKEVSSPQSPAGLNKDLVQRPPGWVKGKVPRVIMLSKGGGTFCSPVFLWTVEGWED